MALQQLDNLFGPRLQGNPQGRLPGEGVPDVELGPGPDKHRQDLPVVAACRIHDCRKSGIGVKQVVKGQLDGMIVPDAVVAGRVAVVGMGGARKLLVVNRLSSVGEAYSTLVLLDSSSPSSLSPSPEALCISVRMVRLSATLMGRPRTASRGRITFRSGCRTAGCPGSSKGKGFRTRAIGPDTVKPVEIPAGSGCGKECPVAGPLSMAKQG